MVIVFNPSKLSAFTFNVTLDNQLYTITVTWNVYAERYFFNIYNNFNELALSRPLIGSPLNYDINLLKDFFTSTMVFRQSTQQFEIFP